MHLFSFYLKIFLFPRQAIQLSKYPIAVSTERVIENSSIKSMVEPSQFYAEITKKFHRMRLCNFYLKLFLFPLQASQRSEYPLSVSTERVFQNCIIKSKVQLCQLNAQIRKRFHRMLLCSFYLKIFLFPLQVSQRSESSLAVSSERMFQNCSIKSKVQICQLNAQIRNNFHRMLLCSLYLKIFLFPLQAS